jgi:hypothetical protein
MKPLNHNRAAAADRPHRGLNGPANRREFLRGSARYTALAVLALVTGRLLGRRGPSRCVNPPGCATCPVFLDCSLPQALSNKQLKPQGRL